MKHQTSNPHPETPDPHTLNPRARTGRCCCGGTARATSGIRKPESENRTSIRESQNRKPQTPDPQILNPQAGGDGSVLLRWNGTRFLGGVNELTRPDAASGGQVNHVPHSVLIS